MAKYWFGNPFQLYHQKLWLETLSYINANTKTDLTKNEESTQLLLQVFKQSVDL